MMSDIFVYNFIITAEQSNIVYWSRAGAAERERLERV